MSTPALPPGRGDGRRTRLYICGDWDTPVYDSATSDMHPDDFLLHGPHRELNAVVDIDQPVRFRWSGIWIQVSRRRIERHDHREYLKYLIQPANPFIKTPPPAIWEGYRTA